MKATSLLSAKTMFFFKDLICVFRKSQPLMLAMIVIEIDFREQQQLIDEPYLQDEFAEFG